MTFTFDNTLFNDTTAGTYTGSTKGKRYQVRFLIGDTDATITATNKRLEDEEIDWRLSEQGNVYFAAAACCEDLLAKWARREVGTIGHQQDKRWEWLSKRAVTLRGLAGAASGLFMSGATISGKLDANTDTDRNAPAFAVGMLDNPDGPNQNPNEDVIDDDQA